MNLFLDSCIVIAYHIPCHPHNKIVLDFYKNNSIRSEITCKKVEQEVKNKLNRILDEFKKSNDISDNDIRSIRHAINKFLRRIKIYEIKSEYSFLFNDLEISLRGILNNSADRDIFSNAVIWTIDDNPANPYFLTLDKKDYRNIWRIKMAVSNCLTNNGYDISKLKLIDIIVLK